MPVFGVKIGNNAAGGGGGGGTITGSGTSGFLAKFTGATAVGNSIASDNGTLFTVNLPNAGKFIVKMGATPSANPFEVQNNGGTAVIAVNSSGHLTTPGTELVLEQTGDTLGATRLRLRNRSGLNGALFENASLELVDFAFSPSAGSAGNLRYEHRSGSTLNDGGAGAGEFQLIPDAGSILLAVGSGKVVCWSSAFGVNTTNTSGHMARIAANGATAIPLAIDLASAQTANALNITSNGGSAGDLLNVTASGVLGVSTLRNPDQGTYPYISIGTDDINIYGFSSSHSIEGGSGQWIVRANGGDQFRFYTDGFVAINGSLGRPGTYKWGSVTTGHRVLAKTTAYPVLDPDSNASFTNEGATARVDFTLPTAVAGLCYRFVVQDTDGIRVIAAAGDTIRINTSVSATAGRIDATAIGAAVMLLAINATEWIALYSIGSWTVT